MALWERVEDGAWVPQERLGQEREDERPASRKMEKLKLGNQEIRAVSGSQKPQPGNLGIPGPLGTLEVSNYGTTLESLGAYGYAKIP